MDNKRYLLTVHIAENDLREPFSVHGEITEVRLFKAQGYAFVRYERKECATNAIMDMNGKEIGGNTIRCSWGRMQQVVSEMGFTLAEIGQEYGNTQCFITSIL